MRLEGILKARADLFHELLRHTLVNLKPEMEFVKVKKREH